MILNKKYTIISSEGNVFVNQDLEKLIINWLESGLWKNKLQKPFYIVWLLNQFSSFVMEYDEDSYYEQFIIENGKGGKVDIKDALYEYLIKYDFYKNACNSYEYCFSGNRCGTKKDKRWVKSAGYKKPKSTSFKREYLDNINCREFDVKTRAKRDITVKHGTYGFGFLRKTKKSWKDYKKKNQWG